MRVYSRPKLEFLREHADRFGREVFIETGTLRGDTTHAMLPHFRQLYTIDINERSYHKAKKRFARHAAITCLLGDSRNVLPRLLETIHEPVLFWLDAHNCGGKRRDGKIDVPIAEEIQAILNHKCASDHVILIDDAKLFTDWKEHADREHYTHSYPHLDELRRLILAHCPDWTVEDIMVHRRSNSRIIKACNDNDATSR